MAANHPPSQDEVTALPSALYLPVTDLHTAGEPTRILPLLPSLYPSTSIIPSMDPSLPLLSKRALLASEHDHLRRLLLLEPRGHAGSYGTYILPSPPGPVQVVFTCASGTGYTPMCGHATLALARYLIDWPYLPAFAGVSPSSIGMPVPESWPFDAETGAREVAIECPAGLLSVTVPVLESGRSDGAREASFVSVPAYAHVGVEVSLPSGQVVMGDLAYGGGWYFLLAFEKLGIPGRPGTEHMPLAWEILAHLRTLDVVKEKADYLYGLILSYPLGETEELGLCAFSDGQYDRSPTGGAVVAREAARWAKGGRGRMAYVSPTSVGMGPAGRFVGEVVGECAQDGSRGTGAVRVRVSGRASYTAFTTVVVEESDGVGANGFAV